MTGTRDPSPEVFEVKGGKRLVIRMLGAVVRNWQSSLRYDSGTSFEDLFSGNPQGSLFLLWHNRLFPGIGALQRVNMRGHRLHALVSASRDGAQLSQFLRTIGLIPIRGSSSRRASTAARECLKVLQDGHHVAITVDGPRGPCYQAQQGAAMLVQQTGAPVNLVGVECESCWTLKSWDRFIVPRPFSRVMINIDHFVPDIRKGGKEGRGEILLEIQNRLTALTRDQHRQP